MSESRSAVIMLSMVEAGSITDMAASIPSGSKGGGARYNAMRISSFACDITKTAVTTVFQGGRMANKIIKKSHVSTNQSNRMF